LSLLGLPSATDLSSREVLADDCPAGAADPTSAFGANLLGAPTGGALEYLALVTGYQALLLVVAVLYLGACAAMRLAGSGPGPRKTAVGDETVSAGTL
jgi:hypothetical protein